MSIGYEDLAQRLIKSGRLRIDAGEDKVNFARLYIPDLDISMMFSYREIYDEVLVPKTKEVIAEQLSATSSGIVLKKKVATYMNMLKAEIRKYAQPSSDEEIKLARLIVQAAHPVVIELLLLDSVEVFISYSHNIGDVLDVINWQTSGSNSGMQSLKGQEKAVFISCGGNPLKENEDPNAEWGDGKPALARILIIGGQEIGHFSDIMRGKNGKAIPSRHSADIYGSLAKSEAREGRIKDIKRGNLMLNALMEAGLFNILKTEKAIKFYREVKTYGVRFFIEWSRLYLQNRKFIYNTLKVGLRGLAIRFKEEPYPGTTLHMMIHEMLFNLAPKADVYSSENKDEEEAIACIEALARVPQQANKWGHYLTKIFMGNLYTIYYEKLIPDCIRAYKALTGKEFTFNETKIGFSWTKFKTKIRRALKKFFNGKNGNNRNGNSNSRNGNSRNGNKTKS